MHYDEEHNLLWKDIDGYEGLYRVSDRGDIASVVRDRMLKPDINRTNNTSYFRVTLSKDGATERFMVHQLVAKAFIENPDSKPMINHINNNGMDNSVGNLEWCTHSENMMHAQKQGRLFESQSKAGKIGGSIQKMKSEQSLEELVTVHRYYYDKERKYAEFVPLCGHGIKTERVDRIRNYPNCSVCNEISKYEKTINKYYSKIQILKESLYVRYGK